MTLPNGFLPLIRLWYFTPEKVFVPRLFLILRFLFAQAILYL